MNYTNTFAFLREQKAFTAFLTTLVVVGSVSAVFTAKIASAEIYAFENAKDVLSDARINRTAAHEITFAPGAANGGQQMSNGASDMPIAITFNDFNGAGVVAGDIQVNDLPLVGSCTAAPSEFKFVSFTGGANPVLTLALCQSDTVAVSVPVKVAIADGKITNPAAITSHVITIQAVGANTHKSDIRVATVDTVHLSAVVDPIFQFTVSGVASGTAVGPITTNITSSSSAIDFGTIAPGVAGAKTGAQVLSVKTNANNGFNVSVLTTSLFESANGATIEGMNKSGTVVSTPEAWYNPDMILGNEATYGHIGISTSDITNTPFTQANFWSGDFINKKVDIMSGDTVADGTGVGADQGRATIFYKTQITDLQEAATDYKTDLVYVATPVF